MSCREGLMSPQTETKASVGFKAGVKDYKLTYYTPDYVTKDTDSGSEESEDVFWTEWLFGESSEDGGQDGRRSGFDL
ncbi:hypothetical protein CUMW_270070, partial [Citrus unshiu]